MEKRKFFQKTREHEIKKTGKVNPKIVAMRAQQEKTNLGEYETRE